MCSSCTETAQAQAVTYHQHQELDGEPSVGASLQTHQSSLEGSATQQGVLVLQKPHHALKQQLCCLNIWTNIHLRLKPHHALSPLKQQLCHLTVRTNIHLCLKPHHALSPLKQQLCHLNIWTNIHLCLKPDHALSPLKQLSHLTV